MERGQGWAALQTAQRPVFLSKSDRTGAPDLYLVPQGYRDGLVSN